MKKFIVKRLGLAAISLFLLSLTIFLLIRISGDPAVLLAEPGASAADLEAIRNQFGLNRPLWIQYISFISHLFRADFGQSFYYRTDVFELYLSRLPASLMLAAAAMVFSLIIGIPTGIVAAVRVNKWQDSIGKIFALLGLSMPSFWVGLVMILFFSVYLGWLPSSGSGTVLHLRDAGHRARLGLRGRPHAIDALVDARGARLRVREARRGSKGCRKRSSSRSTPSRTR